MPGAWLADVLGFGLIGIWCVHQFGFVGPLIYTAMWRSGKWSRISLAVFFNEAAFIALHRNDVAGLLVPGEHPIQQGCPRMRMGRRVDQIVGSQVRAQICSSSSP